ncbi:hypothetical protein LUI11_15415 [Bradyrhizobium diazoefficiens]|uniref:Uncharacterized protein n=1 Tax=Bradyrhizobium diazoefficiens SEMIA 5080 TaxID=754504 RepID=A0A837CMW5_9BRAD|nr:MT-A70 family methyltransferase [Bradyrhizobium diazoefficiens]WAX24296.1 hypothetical protein [Bradyrhizobium phage ppBdUSDA122-1]APO53480.1 hypothetical protein BD122_24445 [Bradyrhizobium diazoefficiens]KGJ69993.1 hypothetical protein BJA5080_04242 [Bradyrhizobium diazoefficiens SEMIA 5080]KOY09337.1 hypothetical protein AF336_15295 [Bradyrhizobium diazoefficiens]MCD9294935.1 hypothetical protein [Bradyrhizobium diazoefficiens]
MTELVKYEAARRALAEAAAVDEVLQIHDEWEAIRLAGKVAKDMELQVYAAKIRFRAERRLGELVREQKKTIGLAKGGQPYQSEREQVDRPATLAEAGVDRKLSARSQRIAEMDPAEFERAITRHEEIMRSLKGRLSMDLTRVVADDRGAEHRRDLAQTLSDASAQLAPSGRKYPVIYADPAWRRHQGVTNRSYENHYPTMTWDEICALPIAQMVLPDAWLFLWIPRAHAFALHEIEAEVEVAETGEIVRARVAMPLGYAVAKAWGFDAYSTCAVWTKTDAEHPDVAGTGKIFRDQDELLLLFKRGQGLPMPDKKFGSNHRERPREHSRKPDFYRDMIQSMAAGLPVLELFARVDAEHPLPEGWGAWGNQANEDPAAKEPEANAGSEVATSGLPAEGSSRPVDGRSSTATSELMDVTSGETAPIHYLPALSGEAEAAAAEAISDGASAAAAVEAPYNAGDVIAIDQLAGSEWLAPSIEAAPFDPSSLPEREALKILSDFCHPRRDIAPALGEFYLARGFTYRGAIEWSLTGKGWDRLRELQALDVPAAPRADLTEPYRAPQMSLFEVARQIDDAPQAEIVDGVLQTRLPVDADELAEQLALLEISAGRWSAVEPDMIRHLVGARGFAHCTTDRVLVTDEGSAFLAQLASPATVQQQGAEA